MKLPSGEIRNFRKTCLATIGTVSNADFKNIRLGKAGRKRWLGIRPTVRGKVMNMTADPSKVHLFVDGTSLLYR